MRNHLTTFLIVVLGLIWLPRGTFGAQQAEAALPAGVKAVWDFDKAFREKSPTRKRVCLNGLWRWQPGAVGQTGRSCRHLGLLQGSRPMAGIERIRSQRIADRLPAPKMAEAGPDQSHQGLVSAGIHRSRRLDRQAHYAVLGLFEFARDRLCGRKKAREAVFPGR